MLYDNSEIFNNMTIWLPTEEEPEYIGTENLARVFHDCEVSKIFVSWDKKNQAILFAE